MPRGKKDQRGSWVSDSVVRYTRIVLPTSNENGHISYARFCRLASNQAEKLGEKRRTYKKGKAIDNVAIEAEFTFKRKGKTQKIHVPKILMFVPPAVDEKIRRTIWQQIASVLEDQEQVSVGSAKFIKKKIVDDELEEYLESIGHAAWYDAKIVKAEKFERWKNSRIEFQLYRMVRLSKKVKRKKGKYKNAIGRRK